MKTAIAKHYAKIGRLGGRASTPAKANAARLNALKRWRPQPKHGLLPEDLLIDGAWYQGKGRNSNIGRWDSQARCFWTIALNDFADPAQFPQKPSRQVRLKREDYFSGKGGTFKPLSALAA